MNINAYIFGYHEFYHIVGGVFFASLLIFSYKSLLKHYPTLLKRSLLPISIALIFYINYKQKMIMYHSWMAIYCLVGIFFSESFFNNEPANITKKEKALATFIYIALFTLVLFSFSYLVLPVYVYQIKWLLIGAFLPVSRHFSIKILKLTHCK